MSKQQAETAHGTVEYETVNCSNCTTEVVASEAISVGVGFEAYKNWDGVNYSSKDTAHLCEYCAESLFGYEGKITGAVMPWGQMFLRRLLATDDMAFFVTSFIVAGGFGTFLGLLAFAIVMSAFRWLMGVLPLL
jgi:hypothetical protein